MLRVSRPTRAAILLLVALLHLSPLLRWRTQTPPKPVATAKLYSTEVDLLERQERPESSPLHTDCPNTYEGMGVKLSWGSGRITHVARGWPADLAGIREGDILLEPSSVVPVAGYMTFRIVRDGREIQMRLRTAQVCFRDTPF